MRSSFGFLRYGTELICTSERSPPALIPLPLASPPQMMDYSQTHFVRAQTRDVWAAPRREVVSASLFPLPRLSSFSLSSPSYSRLSSVQQDPPAGRQETLLITKKHATSDTCAMDDEEGELSPFPEARVDYAWLPVGECRFYLLFLAFFPPIPFHPSSNIFRSLHPPPDTQVRSSAHNYFPRLYSNLFPLHLPFHFVFRSILSITPSLHIPPRICILLAAPPLLFLPPFNPSNGYSPRTFTLTCPNRSSCPPWTSTRTPAFSVC
jgi:hypothetical protein